MPEAEVIHLEGIEDLLGPHGDNGPNHPEHVIAMDDLTDSGSDGVLQPAALPILEVEIVPFPDFNNLQPMIPEEIQVEDLLGFVNPI